MASSPAEKGKHMSIQRRIARTVNTPALTQGFIGPGHLMTPVLSIDDYVLNDPFIMLADDHLDLGERPVGGAHPHAGFETVTLLVEGEIFDRDEGGTIRTGEVQWMTAGSGIIHGENVAARGKVRLLQLWLVLPKNDRWTAPAFQDLHDDVIPVRREEGATVRVYSGASGAVRGPARNRVPVTLVEVVLAPGASFEQELPASYNGFVYPISGDVLVGPEPSPLHVGQVGWLDRPDANGESAVRLSAGAAGGRFVLYAGEPQHDSIVSHGPFIADTRDDIVRLFQEYRSDRFTRLSELAHARNLNAHG
ncbi:MAG: pirin family protein [Luteitalea sp.]|nr:pirin family protein [Luteitalea sp.]